MADRNTKITTNQIKDSTLLPTDLDATNSVVDNYTLKYDNATGKFKWTEISIDGTLAGDSDDAIPTEKAVKSYVDSFTGVDNFTIERISAKLQVKPRLELNTMLALFKISVNAGESQFNMVDGMIDQFEDETGVDTATSTNESYDSANDLYQPESLVGGIDSNTKLMLHCNGTNDSTTFTDDSDTPHTVTANGDAKLKTATKKWGTASGYFDGTGDYLNIPDSPDWDLVASNADNWTIDFWVKMEDYTTMECIICQGMETGGAATVWYISHYNVGWFFQVYDTSVAIITTGATSPTTDSDWHHIALCKVGDEYALYKDGTQINYVQDSSTLTITGSVDIGRYHAYSGTPTDYFQGYIDEMRIQHSNYFSATPNSGLTDTITVPTAEYGSGGGTQNMTLVSNSDTAEAVPSTGRIVLFEEDVNAVTLNTDLKAYMSRDGGSTWGQATLTDEGDYDNNIRILTGTVDFTASGIGSGTSIKWKTETLNNKDLKLHAVGENWD